MTLTIPPELEARVEQRALNAGLSAEEWLRRIVEPEIAAPGHDPKENSTPAEPPPVKKRDSRPTWAVIADNMKNVPPEDLAALPKHFLRDARHRPALEFTRTHAHGQSDYHRRSGLFRRSALEFAIQAALRLELYRARS